MLIFFLSKVGWQKHRVVERLKTRRISQLLTNSERSDQCRDSLDSSIAIRSICYKIHTYISYWKPIWSEEAGILPALSSLQFPTQYSPASGRRSKAARLKSPWIFIWVSKPTFNRCLQTVNSSKSQPEKVYRNAMDTSHTKLIKPLEEINSYADFFWGHTGTIGI